LPQATQSVYQTAVRNAYTELHIAGKSLGEITNTDALGH